MKYDLRTISKKSKERALHLRRKARVRKIVSGSKERPRLSVFKTARHIYVQAIDDVASVTLASVGTMDPGIKEKVQGLKKVEAAKIIGAALGEKLKAASFTTAVFDRNGFRYTGRIAAVADGIRNSGITV
jgi:large subunit ribosomal protein L18